MKRRVFIALLAVAILLLCASCASTPPNEPTNTTSAPPTDDTGTVYTIADYYNASGEFSPLGLALDEENAEKVLTIHSGDALVVGDRVYSVAAESLSLTFYTQPSLDEAIAWWTEYCEGWKAQGVVINIS
jgi:hypothetical protein